MDNRGAGARIGDEVKKGQCKYQLLGKNVMLRGANIHISFYARHIRIMGEKDVGTGDVGYSTPTIVKV